MLTIRSSKASYRKPMDAILDLSLLFRPLPSREDVPYQWGMVERAIFADKVEDLEALRRV